MKLRTKSELKIKLGHSHQHIDRLEARGDFPKRVKPFGTNGRALWVESEVDTWIQQKIDERDSL